MRGLGRNEVESGLITRYVQPMTIDSSNATHASATP
jgi:hypothetical protein